MTAPPPSDSSRPSLLGAVLAGGEGRRFGGPKGGAALAGVPMVQRAVDTLLAVTRAVVVVSSTPVGDVGVPVVPDMTPGAGPLAGLEAALHEAARGGHQGVLLLACDMPLVEPALLRAVATALGDAPAAAPVRAGGGGIEPLCAVYRVEVLDAVVRRLTSADRSLHALFRDVGGRVIPEAGLGTDADVLLNVNTPADGRRAEAALMQRRRPLPAMVCIVGKKKSGKTTTTVGLVRELAARGHRVMTAKHGHRFELDREGTDSWRHQVDGGALRVVMAGPEQMAVMGAWEEGGERPLEELVSRYLSDADVVVAEGFKTSSAAKIEVFRRATHDAPLYGSDPTLDRGYIAILTDVPNFEAHVPVLDVDEPGRFVRLADLVENRLLKR